MRKNYSMLIILGFSLLVGLAISVQIHGVKNIGGGLVPISQTDTYREELQEIRTKKELLRQQLFEYERELAEIKNHFISEDAFLDSQIKLIEKYKMEIGLFDVEGPGILITIDDPVSTQENWEDEYSVIMDNYKLLILIVNKLKSAGAEAVSINGQRITASTTILYKGGSVYINNIPTATPFEIKAIGDPETLESFLAVRYGILHTMRMDYFLQVKVEKLEELIIPKYYGTMQIKYAKELE